MVGDEINGIGDFPSFVGCAIDISNASGYLQFSSLQRKVFHHSWVDKTLRSTTIEERFLIDSPLSGSEHEWDINRFIS